MAYHEEDVYQLDRQSIFYLQQSIDRIGQQLAEIQCELRSVAVRIGSLPAGRHGVGGEVHTVSHSRPPQVPEREDRQVQTIFRTLYESRAQVAFGLFSGLAALAMAIYLFWGTR